LRERESKRCDDFKLPHGFYKYFTVAPFLYAIFFPRLKKKIFLRLFKIPLLIKGVPALTVGRATQAVRAYPFKEIDTFASEKSLDSP
jgi:hypothetical protein